MIYNLELINPQNTIVNRTADSCELADIDSGRSRLSGEGRTETVNA